MGKKKLRQYILFMNYQNRRLSRTSSHLFQCLEEVKQFLNKSN